MLRGFFTALAIGLAILAIAVWRDWYTKRRAERALNAPPPAADSVPELPAPDYVAPVISRPEALSADSEAELAKQQALPDTVRIDAPLWDVGLATSTEPPRSVLDDPLVLVCPEGIGSMREVIPLCEHAARERRALLIAAPTCEDDVIRTLAVNRGVGVLTAAVVRADLAACETLAATCGATWVGRAELQSGAAGASTLGRVPRAICDLDATWLVTQLSTSTNG